MTPAEKKLLAHWRKLPAPQRASVIDFAEFLTQRGGDETQRSDEIPAPLLIPKPEKESVVKAIQRLRKTYPMLEHSGLLHETAHFMSQHLVGGKPAAETILEIEKMFEQRYQKLIGETKNAASP